MKKPAGLTKAAPRISGARLCCVNALFDGGHGIVLRLDGLFEGIVCDILRERHDCRARFVADLCFGHAVDGLKGFFDSGLAVSRTSYR